MESPTQTAQSATPDAGPSFIPSRPASPPLPARTNAHGLPPTYLSHLQNLLHQWLVQQTHDDGMPLTSPMRLWDDSQLEKLEQIIWSGAVLPQTRDTPERRGLLQEDWVGWAIASHKRRKAWQVERNAGGERRDSEDGTLRKKKRTASEVDVLSRSISGLTMNTSVSSKGPSRTPSIASTSKNTNDIEDRLGESGTKEEDEMEHRREWCRLISGLAGFERYAPKTKDEWEVIGGMYTYNETRYC
jgi:hypothetical protein